MDWEPGDSREVRLWPSSSLFRFNQPANNLCIAIAAEPIQIPDLISSTLQNLQPRFPDPSTKIQTHKPVPPKHFPIFTTQPTKIRIHKPASAKRLPPNSKAQSTKMSPKHREDRRILHQPPPLVLSAPYSHHRFIFSTTISLPLLSNSHPAS